MAIRTVLLKGSLSEKSEESRVVSGATITPGMLVEYTTTAGVGPGARPDVQPHSTAGGYAENLFAIENSYKGGRATATLGIEGGGIDDDYAAGDLCFLHLAQPGDEIYALVPGGASAIILTDFLTSAGDGTVKKATSSDQRKYKPLEALDNSASSDPARLKIRVL